MVVSFKPNPAILAEERWRPEAVREEISKALEITKGVPIEIILKDISTVSYEPKRLTEWAEIAMETAASFS